MFILFGLLKKKFKGFTDKIFNKTKDKIETEEPTSEEPISSEESDSVSDTISSPNVGQTQTTLSSESQEKLESPVNEKLISEEKEPELEAPVKEKLISEENEPELEAPAKEELLPEEKEKLLEDDSQQDDNLVPEIEPSIKQDIKKDIQKDIVKKVQEEIKEEEQDIEIEEPINKQDQQAPSGHSLAKDELSVTKELDPNKTSEEYKSLESQKPKSIKKNLFTSVKSIFSSKITLSSSEIESFLEDFEMSLLEADVSINSAQAIVNDLKEKLASTSFSKSNLLENIKKQIKLSLLSQLNIDCDIDNYINKQEDEPLIILFIGPNGAGKTTTISKFAYRYKSLGKSVVLASSDTFRAGSIDQLQVHADRIGVKLVKQTYGSDPAAVAFDAVASAKANKNDVVLIDTAGRQDTNVNLMQELKKIKRVVKPHLTIYIGESQTGQAIVDQISTFDKDIDITGVVLTKIDTDPKGGVAISILNELKKPIFFIGTGQEYKDLEQFSAEYIINRIV